MKLYTTYFAKTRYMPRNIIPISISLWPPKDFHGLRMPELAPTRDILTKFKAGGSWDEYVDQYAIQVLSKLDPKAIHAKITELSKGYDAALCCFENLDKPGAVCHRTLVAKWLTAAGYPVEEFRG